MSAGRWNSATTIKFIQAFRTYECLWDQTSFIYKNKHAREAAYQKLVEEMEITGFGVPEVKRKMRSLRSTYYQERKKIENLRRSSSGREFLYVPNLPWYTDMDNLLKDVDERRSTIDNNHNMETRQTVSTQVIKQEENAEPGHSSTTDQATEFELSTKDRRQSISSDIRSVIKIEYVPVDLADELEDLKKQWLPILGVISRNQRIYAQKIISEILFEGQLGNLSHDTRLIASNPPDLKAIIERHEKSQPY